MDKRTKKINFKGKVEYRDQASSVLSQPGDVILVERGKPRLLVMRCPCQCGDDLLINLDKQAGSAWRFYENRNGLTLFPSYWRDTLCKSHFIVWNNNIYWCSKRGVDDSDKWFASNEVIEAILHILPKDRFVRYTDLADQLGLIPWEVLQACYQLVKNKKAISGNFPDNDQFRKN